MKEPNQIDKKEQANEKDFGEDKSGDDLDVPGGELNDEEEEIGSEDEENNYYSLGGDNHNDWMKKGIKKIKRNYEKNINCAGL